MKRYYLDHNATSILCSDFVKALASGEIPWANPSSTHAAGKNALKSINEAKSEIYKHFNLSSDSYDIIFHSGATEAANMLLGAKKFLIYFGSDHACAREVAKKIPSYLFEINSNGHFDEQRLIDFINSHPTENKDILVHFNFMNSETGVVWDLELARNIKSKTGCSIYVDATQSVLKLHNYQNLDPELDIYTYSGHKFGALKGIGFSFIKKSFDFNPLILGGGQQKKMRSGTLNTHGIVSLKYALNQATQYRKMMKDIEKFKSEIIQILSLNNNIQILNSESINTICFIHKKMKADSLLIHFDRAGLDVSSGSACSAGSVEPSAVLMAMGLDEFAKSSIRISLAASNLEDHNEILNILKDIIGKI